MYFKHWVTRGVFRSLPGVLEEARFFGIEQLAEQLEAAIKVSSVDGVAPVKCIVVSATTEVQGSVTVSTTIYVSIFTNVYSGYSASHSARRINKLCT